MASSEVIGVLGGSFNPVHKGHIELARYIACCGAVDRVWLSLSPSNPLKPDGLPGATDTQRLDMLRLAVAPLRPVVDCTAIELSLPRPSFTLNTLRELSRQHPGRRFRLIIGSDNWLVFDRWRDPEAIINEYGVIIYPRPGYEVDPSGLPRGVSLVEGADLTLMDVSSTGVRLGFNASDDNAGSHLPAAVADYIRRHHLYKS